MTQPRMAAIGLVALVWVFAGCRPAARQPERAGAIRVGLDANPFANEGYDSRSVQARFRQAR
jgi:hypothetical protein